MTWFNIIKVKPTPEEVKNWELASQRAFGDDDYEDYDKLMDKRHDEIKLLIPKMTPDDLLTVDGDWKTSDHPFDNNESWDTILGIGYRTSSFDAHLFDMNLSFDYKKEILERKETTANTLWLKTVKEAKALGLGVWPSDTTQTLRERIDSYQPSFRPKKKYVKGDR